MPISILLIESDHHHAQAVVDALADPWSGWRVDVAQSLAQARDHLGHSRPDIVLAAQRSVDGSAFDLLRLLDGVPAMIIVRKGAETHAAQALRHGFDDYAVQDPALDYLLTGTSEKAAQVPVLVMLMRGRCYLRLQVNPHAQGADALLALELLAHLSERALKLAARSGVLDSSLSTPG